MWLISYKLNIKCIQVTPYESNNQQFVYFEEIIPGKAMTDYMIFLANKKQEEASQNDKLGNIRQRFWNKLLDSINGSGLKLFQSITPMKERWITKIQDRIQYQFYAGKDYISASICFYTNDDAWNKRIYDRLHEQKEEIERSFKEKELQWERRDTQKGCFITIKENYDIYNEAEWENMITFLVDAMVRLEEGFREPLKQALK